MMKKFLVNTILFLLFVAGLVAILYRANFVLRHKEYAGVQDKFANMQEDSIDVVFIGSSHQFCSISPEILYDEYGIESFMLATSAQTVPMSYYAAMEAIELQNPKLIVFEVCYLTNDFRTVTDEMSHCFFDGMPECEAKYKGIEDLIEEENRINYYALLGTYHSRWKELTEADYAMTQFTKRGGVHFEETVYNPPIQVISETETEPIPDEMEKYLDMLVELCKENDVELIMYAAPFNTMYDAEYETAVLNMRQRMFNYIGEYAKEHNVRYYNLFYEIPALGLDDSTDWMDRQHLNCNGQEKFTRYMVEKGYLDY